MSRRERVVGRAHAWLAHTETAALLRSGTTLLFGQIAAAGFAFALTVILARELGSTGYGRLALILTTVTVASQLIDSRVWEAATRFSSEHLASGRRAAARAVLELAILTNLAGGVLAAAFVVLLSGWLAESLLDSAALGDSLRLYAWIAPMIAMQSACAVVFRVLDRIGELAYLTPLGSGLRIAAAAPLAIGGSSLEAIVTALLAAETVTAAVFVSLAILRIRQDLDVGERFRARVARLRGSFARMGRFLIVSNAQGTLRVFNTQVDVLIVGAVAGPGPAGIVRLARTIAAPLALAAQPFYQAIYPQLSRARASGSLAEMRTVIVRAVKLAGAVLLPAGVALAAASPVLVPFLAGSGFSETYEVLIPLAIGTAIAGCLFWVHAAALTLDLQRRSLFAMSVSSAIQFGLVLALAEPLGAAAAGIAYLVFLVAWTAVLVPPVWRKISELAQREAAAA